MKEKILQTLTDLRKYALGKGYDVAIFYHEEDSYLMRFANSAISLNTNEHLIRINITAYEGRKRADYELITDLSKLDEMKRSVDIAAEMVKHAQPLNYDPTVPSLAESFADESGFDPTLAGISNEEKLAHFQQGRLTASRRTTSSSRASSRTARIPSPRSTPARSTRSISARPMRR